MLECYNFPVEDQRSFGSGLFSVRTEGANRPRLFGMATLSVCVLGLVVFWSVAGKNEERIAPSVVAAAMESADGNAGAEINIADIAADAEMTTADIAMIGPAVAGQLIAQYQTLKESGLYTPEVAEAVARELGENVIAPVPYTHYAVKDIKTGGDNSYDAMLLYRGKLKVALEPMVAIKQLEISVFAAYMETKRSAHLAELRAMAEAYAAAGKAAAELTVPPEAAELHAGILNAMGQFGSTLQALADNADDPITVVALLRTYNEAESTMISSFNNLAKYFAHHPRP